MPECFLKFAFLFRNFLAWNTYKGVANLEAISPSAL